MDVLSSLLSTIRLNGALFLNADMHAPWCVNIPTGAELARLLRPEAHRLAVCHLLLEGRCWIRLEDGDPIELVAGDVVTFPRADAHVVGSDLQYSAVQVDHVVQPRVPELNRIRYGGDGEKSVVVCGWFAYDGDGSNPLTDALPRIFRTGLRHRAAGPWIEQSIRFALAEAASAGPGVDALVSRAAEVLFLEALRAYIETIPPGQSGWLAGLKDAVVGRCLGLMHESPGHEWTVDALAQVLNLSRSALAERFTKYVGVPPMQYLTRWRMVVAAGQLRERRGDLARVAASVGYESEAAFNRAFKREFGTTPGQWKRRNQAAGPAESASQPH
ncbi:transcriptional activator FtrA [Variovorax sp. SRS16]|uniref:AraC family transcriptional regulator n=1 Tax=Variovorax sp. SRS16 TaxID=282217 RepID=UPI0013190F28|nr:AraC family transcriptional regulator [Variovorax sp. SRS16]VTU29367.1 transcriptional activator FtrA [Variovorax sp. SRS16]